MHSVSQSLAFDYYMGKFPNFESNVLIVRGFRPNLSISEVSKLFPSKNVDVQTIFDIRLAHVRIAINFIGL